MNAKLYAFRRYHRLKIQEVARELSLLTKEYRLLEEGEAFINETVAQQLSDFYRVPSEIFLEEVGNRPSMLVYNHCIFTDRSNGYVNHLYTSDTSTPGWVNAYFKDPQLFSLNEEIKRLREQNEKLLDTLIQCQRSVKQQ